MNITELIEKKKYGYELTDGEIDSLICAYTRGEVNDCHMAAFAMAVYFRGMTDLETARMTMAMASGGEQVDLSCFGNLSADKHSTGGVGDKTSLIVAPIVAASGGKVAKMSGRGLGHTGGTIDKLEAIPGYRAELSRQEFIRQTKEHGIAIIKASGSLAPADKKLYSLRDITGTVDSIPLIASSVMSKKLAAGAKNIVIDVKTGSGAFMKDIDSAQMLAEKIVAIGKNCGRRISAVITDMNTPLGCTVGNALEVKEAIEVLCGGGPEDLVQVSVALAAELLRLIYGGDGWTQKAAETLRDGRAYLAFEDWIKSQGGKLSELNCNAAYSAEVTSPARGYIAEMDSRKIGEAAMRAGAGRTEADGEIDYSAGIIMKKKTGDFVNKDEVTAVIYSNSKEKLKEAVLRFRGALTVSDTPPKASPLIHKIIN